VIDQTVKPVFVVLIHISEECRTYTLTLPGRGRYNMLAHDRMDWAGLMLSTGQAQTFATEAEAERKAEEVRKAGLYGGLPLPNGVHVYTSQYPPQLRSAP